MRNASLHWARGLAKRDEKGAKACLGLAQRAAGFAAAVDQGGLDALIGQPLQQCPGDELWAVVSGQVRTRCHPQ